MPRGKAVFKTSGSPDSEQWPNNPEAAMEDIADRHGAFYIDGSLVFSLNGDLAEALFRTVEPGGDDAPTRLHQLGKDLDAISLCLYFDTRTWQIQHGITPSS